MNNSKTYQLALAALFAALSYAVFTFLQIKIPVGADMTSIHLGNAVVVLGAFIIGGPLGGITKTDDPKHILRWTIIAAACGLIFNMFADPIIGYWYKILILGKPAADLSLKINFVATTINAVVSLVVSVAVYAALRPALQKAGFFMKLAH